jgi:hypothetical protein
MTIDKVLAVYKTTPIVLVVESEEGTVCELSLTDLRGAGHRNYPKKERNKKKEEKR